MYGGDIHRSDIQPFTIDWIGSSKVPAAFALFPKDISRWFEPQGSG